jgi:hypothetical protein
MFERIGYFRDRSLLAGIGLKSPAHIACETALIDSLTSDSKYSFATINARIVERLSAAARRAA